MEVNSRETHIPRMDRREWLNCNYKETWPKKIKETVICPLNIDIELELQKELYEIAKTLEYQKVHTLLNVCLWPECKATNTLKEKFSLFADDVVKFIVLKNNSY